MIKNILCLTLMVAAVSAAGSYGQAPVSAARPPAQYNAPPAGPNVHNRDVRSAGYVNPPAPVPHPPVHAVPYVPQRAPPAPNNVHKIHSRAVPLAGNVNKPVPTTRPPVHAAPYVKPQSAPPAPLHAAPYVKPQRAPPAPPAPLKPHNIYKRAVPSAGYGHPPVPAPRPPVHAGYGNAGKGRGDIVYA